MHDPQVKKVSAVRSSGLRPSMFESVAKSGEKAVAATRNDMTSQKDCKAEPPRVAAIVYIYDQHTSTRREQVDIPVAQ